jgi:membrane protease YdiL (CAAX protease family)
MHFFIQTVLTLAALWAITPISGQTHEGAPPPTTSDCSQIDRVKVDSGNITITLKTGKNGNNINYIWQNTPSELCEAIKSQTSEATKTTLLVDEMRKGHEAGKKTSTSGLGFFHLYGFGVPQDLKKAETLLRSGSEDYLPPGLLLLASIFMEEESGDGLSKASDLVLESLKQGNKNAIRTGNLALRRLAIQSDPAALAKAEQIIEATLKIDPENAYVLYHAARFQKQQKNFVEAWEFATRALNAPGLTDQLRIQVRVIRLEVANIAGKTGGLEMADFREPLEAVFEEVPRTAINIATGMVTVFVALLLWLLAFLTRRSDDAGPGLILTVAWISLTALGLGAAVLVPGADTVLAVAILLAMLCGLRGKLREKYFPIRPWAGQLHRLALSFLTLVGCLGLLFAISFGYEAAFKAIFGRPPGQQVISHFLRADGFASYMRLMITFAICIPAVEEIAFRGFLMDWTRRRLSWFWSILIVSAVFGIIHGLEWAIPAGFIGLIAGWLRMRTGNLWAPCLLHALNNGIALTLLSLGLE